MSKTEKSSPFAYVIITLLIGSFAVWQDCSLLFQTSAANGIDGYYYVLQINSFLNSGNFYFPTNAPLVLYLLSVSAFFINNTILAVKLGIVILQVLLYLGIANLLQTLIKNVCFAMSGVFITTFSILHLYFLSEFISNLGAMVCLIWGAIGIVRLVQTKKKVWCIFAALMLLAAVFSHRSAFGLIALISFAVLYAYLWMNYAADTKRQVIFGLIILFLLAFPSVLASRAFFVLPDWLLFELLRRPQNPFRSLILMESLMLLISSGTTLTILFVKPEILRNSLSGLILISIVVWSLLITLNPFLNHQTGVAGFVARLDALAYLQTAIAIPLLISLLFSKSKKIALGIAGLFLPLLILRLFVPLPLGLRSEYLQTREKLSRELPVMRQQICEKPFIIAQHGDEFLVTAILELPSQQKPPVENQQYQCIFWLIRQPETNYQIIFDKNITSSDGSFSLVEDSEIRKYLDLMSVNERRILISKNPPLKFLSNELTR